MTAKIRVVVIDDSVVVRRAVATVLEEAGDIEVAATASDGAIGLRRIAEVGPDVVTLDVEMPGMDGLETLARIRKAWPALPVVMFSTLTDRGAAATLDALALGAVDYATKPSGATTREAAAAQVEANLLPLVRTWGRHRAPSDGPRLRVRAGEHPPGQTYRLAPPATKDTRLVVVGVSTGGPDALATVVPGLPDALAVPVVVVQHMPPVFTAMLAQRLDRLTSLPVVEASGGEIAEPGHVYLAPGGRHLEVRRAGEGLRLALSDAPPENSCRPAVDVLFRTAASATDGHLLGVVLTGMGHDGLEGSRQIRQAGGAVIAQDEASAVVWGMPGHVARDGLASRVLPLEAIAGAVASSARRAAVATGGRA